MKNIYIYDPEPFLHDYVSHKFLTPLLKYGTTKGMTIKKINSFDEAKNGIVLSFSGHLKSDVIKKLKEDNNFIGSFDITDSTWLSEAYRWDHEACSSLDAIFKFSGIPKYQYSQELQIGEDLTYYKHDYPYMEDKEWQYFCNLKENNKIIPMPHIPWQQYNIVPIHYLKKRDVLVRGGNHYLRFHLFLNFLKFGLTSKWSGFFMADYHKSKMDADHRFCDNCCEIWNRNNNRFPYEEYLNIPIYEKCNNGHIPWPITDETTFQNKNNHRWNNKCIPIYYWLTETFVNKHGYVDMKKVEDCFSIFYLHPDDLGNVLAHHLFTADYKWIYSIDIPPRFWECSAAKTVSLMPRWTRNQTHFPNLIENEHYITFDEAFEDLELVMDTKQEQYDHITNNCYNLYQKWIKGEEYGISINLMNHIFNQIEERI